MLYISKICDHLNILTGNEVKDFVVIKFGEYFKSTKEKLYSKLFEKKRKFAESLYIFLATPDEVEKYTKMMQSSFSDNFVHHYNTEIINFFDPELQLINTKPMIKNKLKVSGKKFTVQSVLVLLVL